MPGRDDDTQGLDRAGHDDRARAAQPAAARAADPPVARILTGPAQYTQDAAAHFTFDAGGGDRLLCLVDVADVDTDDAHWSMFDTCSTDFPVAEGPHKLFARAVDDPDGTPRLGPIASYTGLRPGAYVFQVRATDAVGLTGTSTPFAFTVDPAPVVAARVHVGSVHRHGRTTIHRLAMTGLPAGTHVRIACHGRGCRFAVRTVRARHGRADLTQLVRGLRLAPGARLVLRA